MRSRIEWLARAVALFALGAAFWIWQFPESAQRVGEAVSGSAELGSSDADSRLGISAVANALRASNNQSLQLQLAEVPESPTRALLHAARDAGWRVEYKTSAVSALAVSSTPRIQPDGGTIIHVAAPNGVELTLSDSLGWIDSVRVSNEGTFWEVAGDGRAFHVASPTASATVAAIELDTLKRFRLIGATGWESRFLMEALETAGWQVDASFSIAPRVSVTAGAPAAIDTSRYAAVIALDSSAWSQAAAISTFVRRGGGLLLFPGSARGTAFASLRAGGTGQELAGIPGALQSTVPTEGLPLTPITGLVEHAVVLERSEREGEPVAVAARRVGAGRVVQVGFEQTWQWRMLGPDDALLAHREWWRTMIQRVAYASPSPVPDVWMPLPGDAAPLADLVARLGSPAAEFSEDPGPLSPATPPRWLFVVAVVGLLVEWWSRRLRGAV